MIWKVNKFSLVADPPYLQYEGKAEKTGLRISKVVGRRMKVNKMKSKVKRCNTGKGGVQVVR